jgi:hypothetical protein
MFAFGLVAKDTLIERQRRVGIYSVMHAIIT